ncbi:YraN family protein [soil metagenome]
MAQARTRLGRTGETLAARHLQARGWRIVARNWRCATRDVRGEVDIIAWDGATLVFCEVKTRRDTAAGGPFAAVTPRKRARLRGLAASYLATAGARAQVRFDVVGVLLPAAGGPARVRHMPGVF